jgi:hypothetical protein
MGMLKIRRGVPLPPIKREGQPKRKWPVDEMQPGDSVLEPGRNSRSVGAYIARVTKNLPGTFTVRAVWMRRDAEGEWVECSPSDDGAVQGAGVWRTK